MFISNILGWKQYSSNLSHVIPGEGVGTSKITSSKGQNIESLINLIRTFDVLISLKNTFDVLIKQWSFGLSMFFFRLSMKWFSTFGPSPNSGIIKRGKLIFLIFNHRHRKRNNKQKIISNNFNIWEYFKQWLLAGEFSEFEYSRETRRFWRVRVLANIRQTIYRVLARLADIRQTPFLRKMWLASPHLHE